MTWHADSGGVELLGSKQLEIAFASRNLCSSANDDLSKEFRKLQTSSMMESSFDYGLHLEVRI